MTGLFDILCRALLLVYPVEFRRRFGQEVFEVARRCEPRSRARVIIDLLAAAGEERWLELRAAATLSRALNAALTLAISTSLLLASHERLTARLLPGLANVLLPAVPRPNPPPVATVLDTSKLVGLLPGFARSDFARILHALTDPTIVFALLVIGVYGLIAELSAPGTWLPGTLGSICLVVGLAALATMPVDYLGLALLLASLGCFLAAVKLSGHAFLMGAGVVLFVGGSLTLFNFGGTGLSISEPVVGLSAGFTAVFFGTIARFGARARKLPAITGTRELVGLVGRARTPLAGQGQVFVRGERWAAECDRQLPAGTPVQVVGVSGFTLTVRPLVAG